jgi:maleylpyruvate isomerase
MKLFGYWRSSSSWRVRIALNLKGIAVEHAPVNLTEGEQFSDAHGARNPMHKVPALEIEPGVFLVESMAIIAWLDERYPNPPLLPRDAVARAHARALAEMVNSGIQPFQNLSVLKHVKSLGVDEKEWAKHWVGAGLAALEEAVRPLAGRFCVGDAPTLADVYLVPQLFGARRFGVDLQAMPTLVWIETACAALPAFAAAVPEKQPDAKP